MGSLHGSNAYCHMIYGATCGTWQQLEFQGIHIRRFVPPPCCAIALAWATGDWLLRADVRCCSSRRRGGHRRATGLRVCAAHGLSSCAAAAPPWCRIGTAAGGRAGGAAGPWPGTAGPWPGTAPAAGTSGIAGFQTQRRGKEVRAIAESQGRTRTRVPGTGAKLMRDPLRETKLALH